MNFSSMEKAYVVVLAGGQSSRLFPFNKVVSDLTGTGRSLIQQVYDRVAPLIPPERFYVLTTAAAAGPIRKQLKLPPQHFLTDPARRGTWPALLWAMAHLRKRDPAATLAVLTADHIIPKIRPFQKAVVSAVATAQEEPAIVLFGIAPTKNPDDWRGFGSLRTGSSSGSAAQPILQFEEKPSRDRAARMIRQGGWFWNAGMFFFRINTAEAALRHYQPALWEIYESLARAVAEGRLRRAARLYASFPAQITHPVETHRKVDHTVDYAILTPMVHRPFEGARPYALPRALTEWADLGEWTALRSWVKPDVNGNIRLGRVKTGAQTKDSILAADTGCSIDAAGVRGCIAAVSQAGALVIAASSIGRVKELVNARQGRLIAHDVPHLRINLHGRRLILRAK